MRLVERLIKIPPATEEQMRFLLRFHVLWILRDKFDKSTREAFPGHYKSLQREIKAFGESYPRTRHKAKDGLAIHLVPFDTSGLPANYPGLPETEDRQIRFVIDVDRRLSGSKSFAYWRAEKNALIVNFFNSPLAGYPGRQVHPEDLGYGLRQLDESIRHELRHVVQSKLFGVDPKQTEIRPDYGRHGRAYYASPIEMDPQIGSAVHSFLATLEAVKASGRVDVRRALRKFIGAVPSERYEPFAQHDVFRALKSEPQRYRRAVNKFLSELSAHAQG